MENKETLLNKAVKFELLDKNLHLTICFLKQVPESKYNTLKEELSKTWSFLNGSMWTLKFLGAWGQNSDFVMAYNKNGLSLEFYRDQIFKRVEELCGEYIDKSRTPFGMPPSHIDVSKLPKRPSGETWYDVNLLLK